MAPVEPHFLAVLLSNRAISAELLIEQAGRKAAAIGISARSPKRTDAKGFR